MKPVVSGKKIPQSGKRQSSGQAAPQARPSGVRLAARSRGAHAARSRGAQAACACSGKSCCEPARVETVSTRLTFSDRLGAWKARFGIGRMKYTVRPGLYAIGNPGKNAPVLVSANYKLTFDSLRKALSRMDCYLLILDTKGINVWCAAGKGTFGTKELVNRIQRTGLSSYVSHRTLILPQLGAVGVDAYAVKRQSGFTVEYGPVRAKDIPAYFAAGHQATGDMRTVHFTTWDRLVLTPMELIPAIEKSLALFGVVFLLNLILPRPFGWQDVLAYTAAVVTGTVLTPVLLPIIPGRAFAWKGFLMGLLSTFGMLWRFGWLHAGTWMLAAGYLLTLPAVSAYLAMNFTGSSTYTSFSGVTKEMRAAIPWMLGAVFIGAVILLVNGIIG